MKPLKNPCVYTGMKTLTTFIATLILGTSLAQFPTPKNTPKGMWFRDYQIFHVCKVLSIEKGGKNAIIEVNYDYYKEMGGGIGAKVVGLKGVEFEKGDYMCLRVDKRLEDTYEFKSDVEFIIKGKDIKEFNEFILNKIINREL